MSDTVSTTTTPLMANWEDIILNHILLNLNQHQALRLATLNSKFSKNIKSKLYRNIHVYLSERLRESDAERDPNRIQFKFHKDINNFKTNKFTIISFNNFKEYMPKMDPNEPIHLLEMFDMPSEFEKQIALHLKKIEYFTVISNNYDAASTTNGEGYSEPDELSSWIKAPNFSTACGDKNYTRKLEYDDCDYDFHELDEVLLLNVPRNDSVKCLKLHANNGYRDFNLINQVSTLTELYITFDITHGVHVRKVNFKITLPLQKLYIIWNAPYDRIKQTSTLVFGIEKAFETRYIQELALEVGCGFNYLIKNDLTNSFPRLRQLCLGINEGPCSNDDKALDEFNQISHSNVQMLIIATGKKLEEELASKFANLFYKFPQANIHWWNTRLVQIEEGYKLDIFCMLSPSLPFAVVGLHWKSNINSGTQNGWKKKYTIKAGTSTGKSTKGARKLEVLFKKIYSDDELEIIRKSADG